MLPHGEPETNGQLASLRDELTRSLTKAITRGIYLALAVAALWSFFDAITSILLFFGLATVFAIALVPPVNWLERRRCPRSLGTLICLAVIIGTFVGLGLLVAPRVAADLENITRELPNYGKLVMERARTLLGRFPALESQLGEPRLLDGMISPSAIIRGIGRYSVSIVTFVVGGLVFISVVAYMVSNPRPLIRGLLQAIPTGSRDLFAHAFARGSDTVVKWMWANAIIGAIEAAIATAFLTWLGIPGAWVWGLVTFFAELIPFLGSYLMAVPPAIVAFSVDPTKALWVVLFYIGMQEAVSNLVGPQIRARTMRIHPVSELFAVLGLSFAFGIMGAILADPLLGFAKAFYDAFYGNRNAHDPGLDTSVEQVLNREVPPPDAASVPISQ